MAFFDLSLDQLRTYHAPDTEPADFDRFWRDTLREAAAFPLDARFERVEEPAYQLVDAYDLTFHGFGGQPVKGWFLEPAAGTPSADAKVSKTGKRPCIVSYVGYGGGRSLPVDHVLPVVAG